MKNKLVTLFGGGGFVGRYVAQELLRAGARVRIAQRRPRDAFFLRPQGGVGQTQFVAADITDADSVARAVQGSDAVMNLVGSFSNYHAIQVKGAQTVAQAANRAGAAAFVQMSAIGADPDSPSEYGRSKAAGERAVLEAFAGATILRPSVIFGREDDFLNRFAGMVAAGPIVPILRPDAKFQPVYVVDVAQAAMRAMADPGQHAGHVYELGGPDVITMSELYRFLAEQTGRDPIFVELPDAIGGMIAALPGTPITADQWRMLKQDNVVSPGSSGLAAFGLGATPVAAVAPQWLVRFRKHGRFTATGEPA
ncbi:complex I NDUFA9 subunit family protein [Stakelama tenebrarum]|uniref:Complex I NDUFA9 subunit family protein n=1 Tax=Stakelama tenebrarum TaxID=2711215 RepID=A0A6G6YAY5_9SPHN|nr:complex I NDUFA9 subunit family protein [Sphingosinithalassobacter tenebrarum]QIG81743.1 complex I NDUFA9 subunit family protein [Sphingosinithalassobacter tenebrarum]